MKKLTTILILSIALIPQLLHAQAVERFPKPDFQTDYTRPVLQTPTPRATWQEWVDVAVLVAALSLASYLALKKRSRKMIFTLMLFSMIYFGFYREGCVCSVGSVQNVAYALFHSGYAIPATVILFFMLPLIFTLFFGRTFCAAVCPLGAIQDVVILKPKRVPRWLSQGLSLLPYLYLGLAILLAATGAGFIICQYDPFIGFYRFGANFNMVLVGVFMLLLGTVVARPYCRFLCPYGVLLNWMSRLSRNHCTITPDTCSECRLCESSCPFDAINVPDDGSLPGNKSWEAKRLLLMFCLLPVLIFIGVWMGSRLEGPLGRQNPTVRLAHEIQLENSGQRVETTESTRTFRASGEPVDQLFADADALQKGFKTGGWLFGGFIGLIIGIKLIQLTLRRKRSTYETDRGLCFSCGRCFEYCPYEHVRRGDIQLEELPERAVNEN